MSSPGHKKKLDKKSWLAQDIPEESAKISPSELIRWLKLCKFQSFKV